MSSDPFPAGCLPRPIEPIEIELNGKPMLADSASTHQALRGLPTSTGAFITDPQVRMKLVAVMERFPLHSSLFGNLAPPKVISTL